MVTAEITERLDTDESTQRTIRHNLVITVDADSKHKVAKVCRIIQKAIEAGRLDDETYALLYGGDGDMRDIADVRVVRVRALAELL